ncbi:MAG: EamA family transporter [Lachnospiraceae bacterium]|nr:EamA family transporter [Lachnospiraceae bacterium]
MKTKYKYMILLHLILALYSVTGIASKFAAGEEFLSPKFILFYGIVLAGLFIYAFFWQQVIKHMPLITAYANKGVTVVWGIVWGYLIFSEEISVKKLLGACVIIAGIVLIVTADAADETAALSKDGEDNEDGK